MFDIILILSSLGSVLAASRMIWKKIPLLLQVPPQLIEESFVTRPSRLRKYVEPIILFFRERRYGDLYHAILIWFLEWFRVRLLRVERMVFTRLEKLRRRNHPSQPEEGIYLNHLKQWKVAKRVNGEGLPQAILTSAPPPPSQIMKRMPRRRKVPTEQV